MKNLPPTNPPTQKKWSFIETSQKNILNQGKQLEDEREKISQADNLSEGEPDVKDSLEHLTPASTPGP